MDTLNKQEAIKRLEAIEQETKLLKEIINKPEKDWRSIVDLRSACKFLNISFDDLNERWRSLGPKETALLSLIYIADAINEGWKADSANRNQKRFYPIFEIENGKMIYAGSPYGDHRLHGQIAYFSHHEKSEHAGKYFVHLYSQIYR